MTDSWSVCLVPFRLSPSYRPLQGFLDPEAAHMPLKPFCTFSPGKTSQTECYLSVSYFVSMPLVERKQVIPEIDILDDVHKNHNPIHVI